MDGINLLGNWSGGYKNASALAAIAVDEDGYGEVLDAPEEMREDKASWGNFFKWLKDCGLDGVKLRVGNKCPGMLEAVGETFPNTEHQRCIVRFYRNVFSVVPDTDRIQSERCFSTAKLRDGIGLITKKREVISLITIALSVLVTIIFISIKLAVQELVIETAINV